MPYETEHAARQVDPDEVTKIRRENGAFTSNGRQIDVLWAQEGRRTVIQSFRFPSSTWRPSAARSWLAQHGYRTDTFEPATGRAAMSRRNGRPNQRDAGEHAGHSKEAIEAAVAEYEAAHWGEKPDRVYDVRHDAYLPSVAVQMGYLRELHVDCVCDQEHEPLVLSFRKPSSVAYSHDECTRVYLVLSTQDKADMLTLYTGGQLPSCGVGKLGSLAKKIGGRQCEWSYPQVPVGVVGICTHIVYRTTKVGDGKSDYIHEFGEEAGGVKPLLCIDESGHMLLAGGSYVVEHRGIVN